METPSELSFSARQAAAQLGLSPAMTRRYAAALERLTGEPIWQHPRDGRQYTRQQLETMLRAKAFVEANARLSIAEALELASGKAAAVATAMVTQEPETLAGAQNETLARELRALVVELKAGRDDGAVVEELRILRAEVAELREDVQRGAVQLSPAKVDDTGAAAGSGNDGPLVRLAKRLERLFKL